MTPRFVSLILLVSVCCSCHRIKHKLSQAKDATIDKVFPTENNQQVFNRRFQHVTGHNIQVYSDYIGIDYKELIGFTCSPADISKIVADKQMELAPAPEEGLFFGDNIDWWDREKMSKIRPYRCGKDFEDRQYLWYDTATMQTWYIAFSL